MNIDCIWWNEHFGSWDHGLIASIFDKHPNVFIQHNTKEFVVTQRAIVLVVGKPEIEPLHRYLSSLKSGVVILLSEEDGFFDWKKAIPEHLEIWTQYFTESKREIKERILLGAPMRIKDYKINTYLPKIYDWCFIGQSQNPFRQKCVEVAKTLPNGFLQVAELFGGQGDTGMYYQQYLDVMCQSKIVLCPSGSQCADSFRVYEAMLCNAAPIADVRCPRDAEDFNYWKEVCGEKFSPICVSDWSELPELLNTLLKYEINIINGGEDYKIELETKLLRVAHELSSDIPTVRPHRIDLITKKPT